MTFEKTAMWFVILGTILIGLARGVFDFALAQAGLAIPLLNMILYWIVVAYVTSSVFALFAAAPEEKGRKVALLIVWIYIVLCVQCWFAFSAISPFLLLGYMLSTPVIQLFG